MLEDYIKEIVKNEIAKDNLNKQYGKNGTSVYELYMKEQTLNKENEKLKKENKILQKSYDFISNNELPELQSKVTSKERIATELGLMLSKEKNKNKELEEKLSKISNVVSLYNTNEITFMSLMSTIDNIRNILKES